MIDRLNKGQLLIASPDIDSGLYFRGVVLLCEQGPSGSFGLLLNKKLDREIPEEVINLKDVENKQISVRTGGPVQPTQLMLLHTSDQIPDQTLEVCPGVFLGGDLNFLQEALGSPDGPTLFLCFGYAGWGPGQLEREFLDGLWFVHAAKQEEIFFLPPEKMWQTLLRSRGGKYATLSMIPDDLSVN